MDPKDKVAIVTGGASGLGKATVQRLAAQGAKVVIADFNDENGKALEAELPEATAFAHCDVTATEDVETVVELAVSRFGRLDIAVNCAGVGAAERTIGRKGPHDLKRFQRTVAVNLFGTFDVIRQAAFKMAQKEPDEDGGRGVIVNTASV
ncbi:MAG TPA: SDR family NAD(P)-dependent oxidoreductase, partial [Candidatus Hydrogenedentes bacterium]|nr:SDR family NAD(P)-dependent oxidoreductase [Candidatus Hydrogenedentota bacterium]